MIRPADRIIIAVAGEGGTLLAQGAQMANPLTVQVISMTRLRQGGDRPGLARELADCLMGDPQHSETVTVITACEVGDLIWLTRRAGAHAVVCTPAAQLLQIETWCDPRWVWERHSDVGADLARRALRDLDNGLATTWAVRV